MDNHIVKWGVIGAVGSIIISLILYLVDPKNIFSPIAWLSWIVYIYAMIKAGQDERTQLDGYMTWGQAIKPTFLTYTLASFLFIVFLFLLGTLIDPGLEDVSREVSMEAIEKMSGLLGEEGMEAAAEQIREKTFFSIGNMALSFGVGLILPGFIFAAIISLIIRKENPQAF